MKKHLTTKLVLLLLVASLVFPAVIYAVTSGYKYVGRVGGRYAYISATLTTSWAPGALNTHSTSQAKTNASITKIGARAYTQYYNPFYGWRTGATSSWVYRYGTYYARADRYAQFGAIYYGMTYFRTRAYGYFYRSGYSSLSKAVNSPSIFYAL